jgi:hypothetical protein
MKKTSNISFLLLIFSGLTISSCNHENKVIDVSNLSAGYYSEEEQQSVLLGRPVTVNSSLSLDPDSTFIIGMENANSEYPSAIAGKWKLSGTSIILSDSSEIKMPQIHLDVNENGSLTGKYSGHTFNFNKCKK